MSAVEIPRQIYDEMAGHCAAAAPLEACGLLAAGSDGVVTRAYPIANVDASPVSYTLDPEEHVGALYDAEAYGWHLAAVFHSHPEGPAVPSSTDVEQAFEPAWLYVVVGLAGDGAPDVRGYRIAGGVVTEEPVSVAERV